MECALSAVSYTHLDVYKRQVFLFSSFTYDAFVIALLMLGIALFVTEYLSEEKIQTKRTMVSIFAMVVGCFSTVSYTHLDWIH